MKLFPYTYGVNILEIKREEILAEFSRVSNFCPGDMYQGKAQQKFKKDQTENLEKLSGLIKGLEAEIRLLKEFNLTVDYEISTTHSNKK